MRTILCFITGEFEAPARAKISFSFKRDFEYDYSKLRILVDSRLENQRIWRFVLISTISQQSLRKRVTCKGHFLCRRPCGIECVEGLAVRDHISREKADHNV